MTRQSPYGQFAVYSRDKYQARFPNAIPAARYDHMEDAKNHADSVTYPMAVVDTKAESRGFIYTNEDTASEPQVTRSPFPDHCFVGSNH
jgi:hypothetical protein